MKKKNFIQALTLTAFSLLFSFAVKAQPHVLSPHDTVSGTVNGAKITIIYGSPAVKGREVWGKLIPYDKAWRAGADEATIFETSKAIKVQGKTLPAGKYTLFAIPGKASWTYVFNSQTGQWGITRTGDANYQEAKNVLTVTAKPVTAEMQERMKFNIMPKGFALRWEKLEVPVTIQ